MTGLVFVGMLLVMGMAAINSQTSLLFGVFGLMLGVLLVSGTISRTVLRRVNVRRIFPEHFIVGERATIQYVFANGKRFWPSFSVSVGELDGNDAFVKPPQAYMLHAAAGMAATVPVEVIPRRRGVHALATLQLTTAFPFGFIKRAAVRREQETFLVYPALATVDSRLLARCLSAEHSGTAVRPRRGGQDEFYGVKDYRAGENPRSIYWRRSARTGTLVAKEMTQVSPPRLLVAVDSHAAARSDEEAAAIERTIAMAASLVKHALEESISVAMCVVSDGEVMSTAASRGKQHQRDLLSVLARLTRNQSVPLSEMLRHTGKLMRPGTTLVLVTPRGGPTATEMARGGWVTISAAAPESREWFRFAPEVDFGACRPTEG